MNNQTAETDVVATPTTEDTNVEGSLDSILSQYDQASDLSSDTGSDVAPAAGNENDTQFVVQYVKNQMQQEAAVEVQGAVDRAIETMKSVVDINIPDKALVGYLNVMADEDPRFKRAFLNRGSNPAVWENALRAAARELAPSNVDKNITEDLSVVTEAITRGARQESRTQSSEAPTKASFDRMSDTEFREWERNNRVS
jgi:DNA-binding NarL/FixJ family response regulator